MRHSEIKWRIFYMLFANITNYKPIQYKTKK